MRRETRPRSRSRRCVPAVRPLRTARKRLRVPAIWVRDAPSGRGGERSRRLGAAGSAFPQWPQPEPVIIPLFFFFFSYLSPLLLQPGVSETLRRCHIFSPLIFVFAGWAHGWGLNTRGTHGAAPLRCATAGRSPTPHPHRAALTSRGSEGPKSAPPPRPPPPSPLPRSAAPHRTAPPRQRGTAAAPPLLAASVIFEQLN